MALADFIGDITAGVFLVGMKIAMPVTFSILLVNIFVVGIPLHLTIGSFMLMMLMPFFILFLDTMFDTMYGNIITALKLISP